MHLISLHIISRYKNLKDFKLEFDGQSFIDVFVGRNGSGKSNFFEALIEVFRHLYEFDSYIISFDYEIEYEIDKRNVSIRWKNGNFFINGRPRKTLGKTPLPDNILVYYSGHNLQVLRLVKEYEESFKTHIKGANISDTRKFIGIGREYKQLLLTLILLQVNERKANEFICKKLGISSVGNEIRISLKRPFYARTKGYEVERLDASTSFWKPAGITKDFLNLLSTIHQTQSESGVREEGYIASEDYLDKYVLYLDVIDFKKKLAHLSSQEVFIQFDNLKTIEMLEEISIDITLQDGSKATTDFFSDGQFQSVYIYSIIELFKLKNCLTLLDEPDSFLHPEWQFDFLKQVVEISEAATSNNHVLMSSHSAITLINHLNEKVFFFEFQDTGAVTSFPLMKKVAINKLSSNLINYTEHEQLLSIINTIQIEKKPVLFTEGKTDPIIIKEAWNKLYPELDMPFIPFYAFGHRYLVQLMKDPEVIADMKGMPIFGLFDYDKAFNSWNGFSKKDISTDVYNCLIKKMDNNEVYAIMLPVPKGRQIEAQVVNPRFRN